MYRSCGHVDRTIRQPADRATRSGRPPCRGTPRSHRSGPRRASRSPRPWSGDPAARPAAPATTNGAGGAAERTSDAHAAPRDPGRAALSSSTRFRSTHGCARRTSPARHRPVPRCSRMRDPPRHRRRQPPRENSTVDGIHTADAAPPRRRRQMTRGPATGTRSPPVRLRQVDHRVLTPEDRVRPPDGRRNTAPPVRPGEPGGHAGPAPDAGSMPAGRSGCRQGGGGRRGPAGRDAHPLRSLAGNSATRPTRKATAPRPGPGMRARTRPERLQETAAPAAFTSATVCSIVCARSAAKAGSMRTSGSCG